MPQINLLKQTAAKPPLPIGKISVWVMTIVFVGLLGYYGFLFVQLKTATADVANLQMQISSEQQTAAAVPNKNELFTRQLQLKTLDGLIAKHVYWSQVLPSLAQVTLKTASYSDLRVNDDSTITLTGTVPTLEDMDLYLRVFDLPEVYKYFSEVSLTSFTKVQSQSSTVIKFQASMKFNPQIIEYSDPATATK